MKKAIYLTVILFTAILLTVEISCRKDNSDNTQPNVEINIPPGEKVTQVINALKGGTISLDNGVKLEVPANALNTDMNYTIQTYRPFEEVNAGKLSDKIYTGFAFSQIVDCGPSGTVFEKPVKLTIPYYPELMPDGYTESDLAFVTYHNEQWDTLEINIDKENHLAWAYVNHFSVFKITKEDNTKWYLTDLSLLNNNNNLALHFKNQYGVSWARYFINYVQLVYDLVQTQEIYYEIKLYRKKTFGKELIADKQFYKGLVYTQESNSTGKELVQGPKATDKSYFSFDLLPKYANLDANSDIFEPGTNSDPGVKYAAVDVVTIDNNENVVDAEFTNLHSNIPQDNNDFLAYSTVDGYNKYFEIVPLSKLEAGKKYFFKIKIRSYGMIETRKFLGNYGEFVTSKFTIDDVGEALNENNPPTEPTLVQPQNNSTNIPLNITLKWTCSDSDGDELKYDIYFGTSSNPPLFAQDNEINNYNISNLLQNTKYYWKIIAKDELGQETSGPVWSFSTGNNGSTPIADFTANPTNGSAPLTVNFTDQSSNAPTSRQWDFGDGGTSTQQNPAHTYNDAGKFTVTLTATNEYGSNTKTATDYIVVSAGGSTPIAGFEADITSGTAPLTVNFTDQSSNTPTSWQWDFGDGNTSTQQNPSHTFNNAGTYTVTLTALNSYGSDSEVKTGYITVTNGGGGTGTFTDPRDGQTYNIVTIGSQTWFAENLNYETTDSWWYDNNPENGDIYGRLYTWDAAMAACPNGWHIPSDNELCILTTFVDETVDCSSSSWSGTDAGHKLKSTSTWHNNGNGSDQFGFSLKGGGYREVDGSFQNLHRQTIIWSSSNSDGLSWVRNFDMYENRIMRTNATDMHGYYLRCIKD